MFNDPIVIGLSDSASPYERTAQNLPRISVKDLASTYKSADGRKSINISHQAGKTRTRTLFRLDSDANVTHRATGDMSAQKHSAYLVIDFPSQVSYSTDLEFVQAVVADLTTFLTNNENAVLERLLGLES